MWGSSWSGGLPVSGVLPVCRGLPVCGGLPGVGVFLEGGLPVLVGNHSTTPTRFVILQTHHWALGAPWTFDVRLWDWMKHVEYVEHHGRLMCVYGTG